MSSMSTEQAMVNYFVAQDKKRQEEAENILNQLSEHEQHLVREAAVMGYALGATAAGGLSKANYPKDSSVVQDVLLQCKSHVDLYPVLGTLDT